MTSEKITPVDVWLLFTYLSLIKYRGFCAIFQNNIGQSSGPPNLDINILPVWSKGISGKGVVVAILDDGM